MACRAPIITLASPKRGAELMTVLGQPASADLAPTTPSATVHRGMRPHGDSNLALRVS